MTVNANRTQTPPASPPPPPERTRQVKPARHRRSNLDLKLSPYLYISPFFILFAVVGIFPIVFTAVISFQEWDLVRNTGTFVGFEQYAWILSQPQFWVALRNTFSIFLLSTVPLLIMAILIAAMLDRNIRAKTFWRMSTLLPFVMAPVAVALIFSNMFGDSHGLVNTLLANIGLGPIPWHTDPFWSHVEGRVRASLPSPRMRSCNHDFRSAPKGLFTLRQNCFPLLQVQWLWPACCPSNRRRNANGPGSSGAAGGTQRQGRAA